MAEIQDKLQFIDTLAELQANVDTFAAEALSFPTGLDEFCGTRTIGCGTGKTSAPVSSLASKK
jgi:hypothetical protein